uniref:Uncharacterized protein n=1 Tax=Panagrolaimus superbus TaxID=310955 RepID=A0A914XYX2_9BILA
MKLIHWLHATPSNKYETDHVSSSGILKELGIKGWVQYLNLLGYPCKHRELLQPTILAPLQSPLKDVNRDTDRGNSSTLGKTNYGGLSNSRGRNANRGFKRSWSNADDPSNRPNRRRQREQ